MNNDRDSILGQRKGLGFVRGRCTARIKSSEDGLVQVRVLIQHLSELRVGEPLQRFDIDFLVLVIRAGRRGCLRVGRLRGETSRGALGRMARRRLDGSTPIARSVWRRMLR